MSPLAPERVSVRFLGAAGTVTGSRHLIRANGRSVLLDCGLFQGLKELRLRNRDRFPVDPASVDAVILSHAHVDHSGYLPRLAKEGFRGPVWCTAGTADLLRVLLLDAAHLQEEEARYANRRGYSKHRPALPLFDAGDAERALALLRTVPFGKPFAPCEGMTALFRRAGHILGSATVELRIPEGGLKRLVYTGDLGRPGQPILRDPEPVAEADVLVLESTYGDRLHPPDPVGDLAKAVREAAERRAAILIPAFAVGRTQALLWHLGELEAEGRIPALPLFVDSPMASAVSRITCRHAEDLDEEMRRAMAKERCPICSGRARFLETPEQSKSLNDLPGPMIVIAGSGMATGGRILHHFKRRLPDPSTVVLFVGYQAAGTRGQAMLAGAKRIRMHGEEVPVAAQVRLLDGLSAHADREETFAWLKGFRTPPKRTWLVHGDPMALSALAAEIRGRLGWEVEIARDGQEAFF